MLREVEKFMKVCLYFSKVVQNTDRSLFNFTNFLTKNQALSLKHLNLVGTPCTMIDFCTSRQLAMHERVYCWFLIFVGLIGGVSATYTAIKNIVAGAALVPPCYVKLT